MADTEVLATVDLEHAAPLLKGCRYKPYSVYSREFGQEAIDSFFVEAVGRRLDVGARTACLLQAGRVVGLALWSVSELESRLFGFRSARLEFLLALGSYEEQRETKRRLLKALTGQWAEEQVRHVLIRVDAADVSSIHALEEQAFILVDGLITYGRKLDGGSLFRPSPHFEVRPIAPVDLLEATGLARSSFSYDRLHIDPAIPDTAADAIHAAWLENSCTPSSSDRVLVAADKLGILGYSVYRVNWATVPHFGEPIGVWVIAATAERARGLGVAKSLCLAMLDWYAGQGVRLVEGGTQLANVASARLHESCNFRVVSSSVSLSCWLRGI